MKTLIIQHIQFPLLTIGVYLRYLIGRRRFKRRSFAGRQYFRSYSAVMLTLTIEKLVNYLATLCILVAIILYLF